MGRERTDRTWGKNKKSIKKGMRREEKKGKKKKTRNERKEIGNKWQEKLISASLPFLSFVSLRYERICLSTSFRLQLVIQWVDEGKVAVGAQNGKWGKWKKEISKNLLLANRRELVTAVQRLNGVMMILFREENAWKFKRKSSWFWNLMNPWWSSVS